MPARFGRFVARAAQPRCVEVLQRWQRALTALGHAGLRLAPKRGHHWQIRGELNGGVFNTVPDGLCSCAFTLVCHVRGGAMYHKQANSSAATLDVLRETLIKRMRAKFAVRAVPNRCSCCGLRVHNANRSARHWRAAARAYPKQALCAGGHACCCLQELVDNVAAQDIITAEVTAFMATASGIRVSC